jgi:hypothetical protein
MRLRSRKNSQVIVLNSTLVCYRKGAAGLELDWCAVD